MTDQPIGEMTDAERGIWEDGFVGEGGPDPLTADAAAQAATDAIEQSLEAPADYSTGDDDTDEEVIR